MKKDKGDRWNKRMEKIFKIKMNQWLKKRHGPHPNPKGKNEVETMSKNAIRKQEITI